MHGGGDSQLVGHIPWLVKFEEADIHAMLVLNSDSFGRMNRNILLAHRSRTAKAFQRAHHNNSNATTSSNSDDSSNNK